MSEAKRFQDWKVLGGVKEGDILICVSNCQAERTYTRGKEYVVIVNDNGVLALADNWHRSGVVTYCLDTVSTFIKKEEKKIVNTNVFDGKQLFGKKYRVTPETSKLIQEAVFAAGGCWRSGCSSVKYTDTDKFMFVTETGCLTTSWSNETAFIDHKYPEGIITVEITGVTAVDKEAEAKKKQLEELDRKIKELQAIADKLKEEK